MKPSYPFALALFLALLGMRSSPLWAGPNENAKMILHIVPVVKKTPVGCGNPLPKEPTAVRTAGAVDPQGYYAYVLVTDYDVRRGLAGVQFGISYDDSANYGVDILSWQSCALYEWPMDGWPASETGDLLTWNQAEDCQEKVPLPVGFFYVIAYSPDRLKLIPRPVDGLSRVAVCGIEAGMNGTDLLDSLFPENLGWVDFGGGKGYNPWDPSQNIREVQKRFQPIKNGQR
jgi:hypothetical protein